MHDKEIFGKISHCYDFLPRKLIIMNNGDNQRSGDEDITSTPVDNTEYIDHYVPDVLLYGRRIPLSHYRSCGELF